MARKIFLLAGAAGAGKSTWIAAHPELADLTHSWDAEHRRQLERARTIGGGYSAHGIHGAHGAEQTRPVTVEAYSEAPAEAHPAQPGLLARVARRLRG